MEDNKKQKEYYDSLSENISNFVCDRADLKKTKGKDTILITDYKNEDGKLKVKAQFEKPSRFWLLTTLKEYCYDILIVLFYLLVSVFTGHKFYQLLLAVKYLDTTKLNFNIYIMLTICISTILIWFLSTSVKILSLTAYKTKLLNITLLIDLIWFLIFCFNYFYNLVIPWIGTLKPSQYLTASKIIGLAWILTVIPSVVITIVCGSVIFKLIYRPENLDNIRCFKAKHYIDFKNHSKYDYDISFFRDDENGKKVTIYEHDRWLHFDIIGATGTGKTSSIIIPMINNDLNKKVLNEDKQKNLIKKYLKKGWVYMTKPFEDEDFSIHYVKPNPGHENVMKELYKYQSAGITVMGPDDSLSDEAYELAKAKGFKKINRIDARRHEDGTLKEGSKGFNPFYISPLLNEWEREKQPIKKATLFADLMQIMYEMSGKSDPYFSSINRIASTTVAVMLMVTYPLINNGKQPNPGHLQLLLNNFDRIKPYYDKLVEIDKDNKYEVIRDTLKNDFLGRGREEFEKHSRGLRVQINNFLLDTEIRRILCSEDSIDMDKMLRDGEITVVNFELGDLGEVNSPAFALFFSLSFENAVLRRKGNEWTRLPHFWVIDEFPILVSPSFERNFVLFRKFRVSMTVAMQTLDQLNKNPYLKYLKGILLNSCGNHIIFGRTNPNDGDLISQLAGEVDKVATMQGTTKSSILNDNPSLTFNERQMVKKEVRISASQQRNLDFQEITYFITKDGRALAPRFGKVYFLTKKDKRHLKRVRINWKELMEEQTEIRISKAIGNKSEKDKRNLNESIKQALNNVQSEVSITNDEEDISKDVESVVSVDTNNIESNNPKLNNPNTNNKNTSNEQKQKPSNRNKLDDNDKNDKSKKAEDDSNATKVVATFKPKEF